MADSKIDIVVQTPKDIIDKLNTLLNWKNDIIGVMRSKHIARNAELNVNEGDSLEKINSELEKNTYELTAPKFPTTIGAGKPSTVVVKDVPINCYVEVDGQKFFVDENTPSGSHSFGKNLSVTTGVHGKGEQVTFYVKTKYDQDLFNGVANVTLGLPYTNFVKYTMKVLESPQLTQGNDNNIAYNIESGMSSSISRLVITLPKDLRDEIHRITELARSKGENSVEKVDAYIVSVRRVFDDGSVDWTNNGLLFDWLIRDDILFQYSGQTTWYTGGMTNIFLENALFSDWGHDGSNSLINKVFRNHFYPTEPNSDVDIRANYELGNEAAQKKYVNSIRRDQIRPIAVTIHKAKVPAMLVNFFNNSVISPNYQYSSNSSSVFERLSIKAAVKRSGWLCLRACGYYDPADETLRTVPIIIDPRTMSDEIFPWLEKLKLTVKAISQVYESPFETGGISITTLDPDESNKLLNYFESRFTSNNPRHKINETIPDWIAVSPNLTNEKAGSNVKFKESTTEAKVDCVEIPITLHQTIKIDGKRYLAFIIAGQAPFLEDSRIVRGNDNNISGYKELIHETPDGIKQYHVFLPGTWTYGRTINEDLFFRDDYASRTILGSEDWTLRNYYRMNDSNDVLPRVSTTNNMAYVGYLFLIPEDVAKRMYPQSMEMQWQ